MVTLTPALTQYIIGMPMYFKALNANTGASTLNVNGLGVKTLHKNGNSDLISGDIVAGQIIAVAYDGTSLQLISPGHGVQDYAIDVGAVNAFAITLTPSLTQYVVGLPIYFKALNANTGTATLNVNGLGAKTIRKNGTSPLTSGDIVAGQIVAVAYDGTYFQLISAAVPVISPNETIKNLKLVRNASVNQIDIFARSNGAAPTTDNPILVPIPDGNGQVVRTRADQYLSGNSNILFADGAGYWGKASLTLSQYWACLYAIWDGTGIVWAASANPYLQTVSTTTTASDPSFMLLENGSTYVRNASHLCQMVGVFEFAYDTTTTPDYTFISDGFRVCPTPPDYLTNVGMVQVLWKETPPINLLELDGSSLLRSSYKRLFTHFGGPI